MHLVLQKVSVKEIMTLVNKKNEYLMRAAQTLSYPSLAFLIDFGSTPFMSSKFEESSEVLKTFITNLTTSEISEAQKKENIACFIGI